MLRELHDISAEEQMGADLFTSRVDAFHKKITTSDRLIHPSRGFTWIDDGGLDPDRKMIDVYVAEDDARIPVEIDALTSVEYMEGDPVGEPYKATNPPHELYQDVHTHGIANVFVGGIPVRQVKLE